MCKYDVVFDDSNSSVSKGFSSSYDYCMDWIEMNRSDKSSYFGDYVGGTVSIINIDTGDVVYTESISK